MDQVAENERQFLPGATRDRRQSLRGIYIWSRAYICLYFRITWRKGLQYQQYSRDNPINAYKGQFINLNYRINITTFGSTQNSTLLLMDYRYFQPIGNSVRRNVLAFWLYANFVTSGNVPYLMLPAIGYDQRQKSGRGYAFGRFRGQSMLYEETEYRFPLSRRNGILGGVLFSNFTTNSNRDTGIKLLEYIQPAYGAGLRLLLDMLSRTHLQLDGAIGRGRPTPYFGIRETF